MATLTVNITETITLNGKERGGTNVTDINGVSYIDHRILSVSNSAEQSLVLFDTAVAAGQFADSSVDYLRITNLDSTNYITLRFTSADDEYFVKLAAGDSHIMFETVMDADNDSGAATATLTNIDSIKAQANTAACDVEIFIAA